jgi:hypothetical protein
MCCHWCDVKESWNAELHPSSINQNQCKKIFRNSVVGGAIDVGYDPTDPDALKKWTKSSY